MAHLIETCDFLDVLEESAVRKSAVVIELRDGRKFTDTVRDVVTEDGQDFALFATEGRMPVHAISRAGRAEPLQHSYAGKLGQ